jgi:hypothetical protein
MNADKIFGFVFIFGLAGAAALADVPVLSVCDVLDNRLAYNGKTVIVVGRVIRTMEGHWLDQECGKNLVINGYGWRYLISLSYLGSTAKPQPPLPPGFQWDTSLLSSNLKEVQKTTTLRSDGGLRYPEEWAAVFGRFDTLERFPGHSGFGHMGGGPARLVGPQDGIRFEDDSWQPQPEMSSPTWRVIRNELKRESGPDYFDRVMKGNQIRFLMGTVIDSSPPGNPDTLIVKFSVNNVPEATLKLDRQLKHPIPVGQIIEFEGVATAFTQNPLVVNFVVRKTNLFVFRHGKWSDWQRPYL